ncbi:metaxin 1 [Mortierella sp. GBA30]|nr:metaxin 1 [Mortierella sp. GBA30]
MSSRELYIFGSAFGLPSIDPQCLAIISYMSIVALDYSIIECNDPALSPTGELPMLHDGKNWIAGANRIIAYLSRTGHNADEKLPKEMIAKSVSHQALVDETLADTILFSWFADSENYVNVIRKAYSDLLPFPTRYYLPIQMKKSAIQRVQKYGGRIESSGSVLVKKDRTQIYDVARDCYKVLNRRLGDQNFFFGETPTTLDAKVFGYLALQMYPEIPNRRFGMILESQFPRLATYCDRCRNRFLQDVPKPSSTLSPSSSGMTTTSEGEGILSSSGVGAMTSDEKGSISNPFAFASAWFKDTFMFSSSDQRSTGAAGTGTKKEKTPEERDFERKRIFAIGLGLVAMVAYMIGNGMVVITTEKGEEVEEDDVGGGIFGTVGGGAGNPVFEQVHLPTEDFEHDD